MKQKLRKQFLPNYIVMMHKKFQLRQRDFSKRTKVTSTSTTAARITNRVHKKEVHFVEADSDEDTSREHQSTTAIVTQKLKKSFVYSCCCCPFYPRQSKS